MRRFHRTAGRDDDYDPNRAAVSLYKDGRSSPLESLRLRRNENGARRRVTETGWSLRSVFIRLRRRRGSDI